MPAVNGGPSWLEGSMMQITWGRYGSNQGLVGSLPVNANKEQAVTETGSGQVNRQDREQRIKHRIETRQLMSKSKLTRWLSRRRSEEVKEVAMEMIARCGCGSGQQNKGSAIACNFVCFNLRSYSSQDGLCL